MIHDAYAPLGAIVTIIRTIFKTYTTDFATNDSAHDSTIHTAYDAANNATALRAIFPT